MAGTACGWCVEANKNVCGDWTGTARAFTAYTGSASGPNATGCSRWVWWSADCDLEQNIKRCYDIRGTSWNWCTVGGYPCKGVGCAPCAVVGGVISSSDSCP